MKTIRVAPYNSGEQVYLLENAKFAMPRLRDQLQELGNSEYCIAIKDNDNGWKKIDSTFKSFAAANRRFEKLAADKFSRTKLPRLKISGQR